MDWERELEGIEDKLARLLHLAASTIERVSTLDPQQVATSEKDVDEFGETLQEVQVSLLGAIDAQPRRKENLRTLDEEYKRYHASAQLAEHVENSLDDLVNR